jgi:aminopeptidase N
VRRRPASIPLPSGAVTATLALSIALLGMGARSAPAAEPFFPDEGDRGYDARRYVAHLAYQPSEERLVASAKLVATARTQLTHFSLDLRGLRVTAVSVNGERALFSREKGKLRVFPAASLAAGQRFVTRVAYRGRPRTITDPDGSKEGWYPTRDGALAVGEPVGTEAWLPCNNVPVDKASFEIALTVPAGLTAVSNGRLIGTRREGARKTFEWRERQPMSTYLAVVDIGRGKLVRGTIAGLPSWTFTDAALAEFSRRPLAKLPEIVRFEARAFGSYPFDAAGSIVDFAPRLGYALETQTRPIYAFLPDVPTLVHETAHQWFGDSVGLERWPDIWLNEGFATWTEWFYAEHHGGRTARQIFRRLYALPASSTGFWDPPSADPGSPKLLFASSTYVRGAMALEALRVRIGTPRMLRLLRLWVREHRHGSANTHDFVLLAERVSGQRLRRFFAGWLYRTGKPPGYGGV